jgi:hypothetical protein
VTAEAPLIADARSITSNGNGTFDVVCKDGSRAQNVTAAGIAANEVCNGPIPHPPSSSSWSAANHRYQGDILAVSNDEHHALVNFTGVGFGRFDLQTYALTHSYGDGSAYGDDAIYSTGSRIVMIKSISFPGTMATGFQVDLRDLDDPSFVHTILRPPTVGAGNLVDPRPWVCRDGRVQWAEGNKLVAASVAAGSVSLRESTTAICPEQAFVPGHSHLAYPKSYGDRKDLVFTGGAVQSCSQGSCTTVRAMPAGTKWVVFSKTGSWLTYEMNGVVYRDSVAGTLPKSLPYEKYVRNARDGKLVAPTDLYDIDADAFSPLGVTVSTLMDVRYLPNGVAAYYAVGSQTLLVNAKNETALVDFVDAGDLYGDFSPFRPGLAAHRRLGGSFADFIWIL